MADGQCPFDAPDTLDEVMRQWSIYQPWLQEDPIPLWSQMRDKTPIVWSEALGGFWILTRAEDIEWAARNPETFSNSQLSIPHRDLFPTKQIPIQLDGDEHRKWRQALSHVFNPATVNHFSPQIRQAVVDTIEPVVERGRCEFVEEIANRLPAETFLINFGIGREYLQQLLDHKTWLRTVGLPNAHTEEALHAANRPLWDFFGDALDRRRVEGTEGRRDVFSQLLNSTYDGRPPTRDEMINAAFVAMLASLDTTASALGLIFHRLAEQPELAAVVREQPDRIPAVTEELLRHEPVSTTARVLTQDVERHGVTMRAGERVLMSWGMAGLDPDAFDRADEVVPDRSSSRHLAFAVGPHRCLGMHVARRVLTLALAEWHTRVPAYRVMPGSTLSHHYGPGRGLDRLELVLG